MRSNVKKRKDFGDGQETLLEAWGRFQNGLVSFDSQLTINYINETAAVIFGGSVESLPGTSLASIPQPYNDPKFLAACKKTLAAQKAERIELKHLQLPNHYEYCLHPSTSGLSVFINDVTQRVIEEEKLQLDQARYKLLAENMQDVIWVLDLKQNRFSYFSPSVYHLIGNKPEELVGQPIENIFSPASLEIIGGWLRQMLDDQAAGKAGPAEAKVLEMTHANGSSIWAEIVTSLVLDENNHPRQVIGVARDISQRMLAEKALRKSEERNKTLLEKSPDGYMRLGLNGRLKYASPSAVRLLGYTAEDWPSASPLEFTHPDDLALLTETLQQIQKDPVQTPKHVVRFICNGGGWRWFECTFNNLLMDDAFKGILINFHDVHERIENDTARHLSEEKFARIFEISPDALIISVKETGVILDTNESFGRMTGYERDELIGSTLKEKEIWDVPEDRKRLLAFLSDHGRVDNLEIKLKRKNGEIITGLFFIKEIEIEGRECLFSIFRDITQQKLIAEARQQAEILLQKSRDELETRVEERTQALQVANATLMEALVNMDVLYRVSQALIEVEKLENALQQMVDTLADVLMFDRVILAVLDDTGNKTPVIYFGGFDRTSTKNLPIEDYWGDLSSWVMLERKPVLSPGGVYDDNENPIIQQLNSSQDLGSLMVVPIIFQDKVLGTLSSINRPGMHQFTMPDMDLLMSLANQVAGAIENNRLFRSLMIEIADRQAAQADLQKAHDDLELRVRERTAELQLSNRNLKMLSTCSQVIAYAVSEQELIDEICRVIVETGGYMMSWIGYAEFDEQKTVRPAAWVGLSDDYLETLKISWADDEFGKGPTGTAIRTRKPFVIRDFEKSDNYKPWIQSARAMGYTSSASLPLLLENKAIGSINIYSDTTGSFDEAEVEMLMGMSTDLAYGINALRTRNEMILSEDRFSSAFHSNPAAVTIIRLSDSTFVDVNESFCQLLGYTREMLVGKTNSQLQIYPDPRQLDQYLHENPQPNSVRNLELRLIRNDGQEIFVISSAEVIVFNGQEHALSTLIDITESKKAAKALQESEARYRLISENSADVIWTMDAVSLKFNFVSPSVEKMLGYSIQQMKEIELGQLIDAASMEKVLLAVSVLQQGSQPAGNDRSQIAEIDLISSQGVLVPVEIIASYAAAEDGQAQLIGIARDITERKKANELLEKSQASLELAQSMAHMGSWELDVESGSGFWSREMFNLFGYSKSNGTPPLIVFIKNIHPQDRDLLMKAVDRVVQTSEPEEITYRLTASGSKETKIFKTNIHAIKTSDGQFRHLAGTVQDITLQYRAQENLNESIETTRTILNVMNETAVLIDIDGSILAANQRAADLLNWKLNEMTGRNILALEGPGMSLARKAAALSVVATGMPAHYDDSINSRLYSNSIFPVFNTNGQVSRLAVFGRDVTESKMAEIALRESEDRFRSFIAQSSIGQMLIDESGNFLEWNQEMVNITGLQREQVIGQPASDILYSCTPSEMAAPNQLEYLRETIRLILQNGEIPPELIQGETLIVTPGGGRKIVEQKLFLIHTTLGYRVGGTLQEITLKKQDETVQLKRLELIEFAAGHSLVEIMEQALDELEELIQSRIGFFHLIDEDQQTLRLTTWSTRTKLTYCRAEGEGTHYPLEKAGIWADSVRERSFIVHNDYKEAAGRMGLPAGHAELLREISLPIIRDNRVIAVMGVGNKETDYTPRDLEIASRFSDYAGDIIERKIAEREVQRMLSIMETAQELIASIDTAGSLVYINPSGRKMLGIPEDSSISSYKNQQFYPVDNIHLIHNIAIPQAEKTGSWQGEAAMESLDGERYHVLLNIIAHRDFNQQITHFSIIANDISSLKASEEALKQSEYRTRSLLNAIPDIMFRVDRDGIFLDYKADKNAPLIIAPEQFLGKRAADFMPQGIATVLEAELEAAFNTPGVHTFEYELPIDLELHYFEARVEANNITGEAIMIIRDITERRHAEQLENQVQAKFRSLFHNIPMSGVIYRLIRDDYGKIIDWELEEINELGARDINAKPHEVIGKLATELYGAETMKPYLEICRKVMATNVPVQMETYFEFNKKYYLTALFGMGEDFYANVSIDITENKKTEQELILYRDQLEELVKARTAELEVARDLAEGANRAKSEFLAVMSHEIRTPMNGVLGLAQLMQQTPLNEKQRDYLAHIQVSGEALMTIINDILDFSKIEAGKLHMEAIDFNLDEVLNSLANMAAYRAQEKGLELVFNTSPDVPRHLYGDPSKIRQILLNLVGNSIKFTEAGNIVIRVQVLKKTQGRVKLEFSVRDTGIGMSEKQMAQLFEPFTQADSSMTRKYGGTGLGLTISKRLIKMMGGEIKVKSKPRKGSNFTFTLDLECYPGEEEYPFVITPDLRNLNVLLVEDNHEAITFLQNVLSSFGFNVTPVNSAKKGLELIQSIERTDVNYDLVIVDKSLPGGTDGLQVVQHIRSMDGFGKQPVILMAPPTDKYRLVNLPGLNSVLVKPLTVSMIFDAIMQVFGHEVPQLPWKKRKVSKTESLESLAGKQVLLVEDNEINQIVARELLEKMGMIVSIASNGLDGFNMTLAGQFDVVIMDIQMPGMDGYEATMKIRSDPRFSFEKLPIIAMTAHALTGDREKAIGTGMNDYLTKPIEVDQLVKTLLRWFPGQAAPAGETFDEGKPSDSVIPILTPRSESAQKLDKKAAIIRLGGNEELYDKLLNMTKAEYADAASKLALVIARKDIPVAIRMAHTLKGVAGTIGAVDLVAAARKLEHALSEGRSETYQELLESLAIEIRAVL